MRKYSKTRSYRIFFFFTVDIEVDANGNVSSASVDGNDSIFKIDGNKLVGAEGTEYEGLTLFFGGAIPRVWKLVFPAG